MEIQKVALLGAGAMLAGEMIRMGKECGIAVSIPII